MGRPSLVLDRPAVLWRVLEFLPYEAVIAFIRANKRCFELGTHNVPWKIIVERTHLGPLLPVATAAYVSAGPASPGSPAGGSSAALVAAALSTSPNATYTAFVGVVARLGGLVGEYCYTSGDPTDRTATFSSVKVLVTKACLGYTCPVVRIRMHLTASGSGDTEWYDGVLRFDPRTSQLVMATWTEGFRFVKRLQGPTFNVLVSSVQRGWACQSKQELQQHLGGLRLIFTMHRMAKQPLPWSSLGPNDILAVSKPPPKSRFPSRPGTAAAAAATPIARKTGARGF